MSMPLGACSKAARQASAVISALASSLRICRPDHGDAPARSAPATAASAISTWFTIPPCSAGSLAIKVLRGGALCTFSAQQSRAAMQVRVCPDDACRSAVVR